MNSNSYLTEIFAESLAPILFIDFDGTISKRDVIDRILEEFANESWLETEEKWISGEIGSRTCLRKQFALVRATPQELNEFLDTLELDEGFLPLLDFCFDASIKVHIVSDGFDYYIRRMLEKAVSDSQKLNEINVWANVLTASGKDGWHTAFPYLPEVCADGCATCKPQVLEINNLAAAPSIFVGDGLSDRFAAQAANVVFAKSKLKDFCRQSSIEFVEYDNLRQVAESLEAASKYFVGKQNRFGAEQPEASKKTLSI